MFGALWNMYVARVCPALGVPVTLYTPSRYLSFRANSDSSEMPQS
jgi:hypothetical protein